MRILFGFCLLFCALAEQSFGESALPTGKMSPLASETYKSGDMRAELDTLAGTAEEIYSLSKAGKWHKIQKKFDDLKKSEKAIDMTGIEENNYFRQRLKKKIDDLGQAIAAKSSNDTRRFANSLMVLEIAMIGEMRPRVPTSVMLLGYCGRELEILSDEKDMEKLNNLVIRMHLIWQNLIPQLVDRNASREIKNFSELMKSLERAKSPEEYGQSAKHVLEEVHGIEKIFLKYPR